MFRQLAFSLLLLAGGTSISRGQQTIFEKWDSKVLSEANTAQASALTSEEKKVILYVNLARMQPQLFAETILRYYLDSTGTKPNSYVKSLQKQLLNITAAKPLAVQDDLNDIARQHAEHMGKTGKAGHEKFEQRTKHVRVKYKGMGENCDYGYNSALVIVMRLLIDNGIPKTGHRKNILDPNYEHIGVSIQPHKKWRHNCVMEFGRKRTTDF